MNNAKSLFASCVEALKEDIPINNIDLWISVLEPVGLEDGVLVLLAPNIFIKSIVEFNYKDTIKKKLVSMDEGVNDVKVLDPSQGYDYKQSVEETSKKTGDIIPNLNPYFTFNRFIPGDANLYVFENSKRIAENPGLLYNPFFLFGKTGLGKTHLINAIGNKMLKDHKDFRLLYITSEDFTNELISCLQNRTMREFKEKYRSLDCLIIDDIQFLSYKDQTQEEFFHTFNALYSMNKQIIIASDRSPSDIKNIQDRIISRFESGLTIEVKQPPLETRIAILKAKADEENLDVSDDVLEYIAKRAKQNIRQLEGALMGVKAASEQEDGTKLEITVPLAKSALDFMSQSEEKEITIDSIKEAVAKYFNISIEDINSKRKHSDIAIPRQIAMYFARVNTDLSYPKIGEAFGGRDHSTVIYAYEKILKEKKTKANIRDAVEALEKIICG